MIACFNYALNPSAWVVEAFPTTMSAALTFRSLGDIITICQIARSLRPWFCEGLPGPEAGLESLCESRDPGNYKTSITTGCFTY
jgi:hypothetical protein